METYAIGYSLEAPRQGASNEYPQHIFAKTLLMNKQDTLFMFS